MYQEACARDCIHLFDELDIAVFVIRIEDGTINYINNRVCSDLKMTYGEIAGKHFKDVFRPEFSPLFANLIDECRDGKEHSFVYYWAEKAIWEQVAAHSTTWGSAQCIMMSVKNISEVMRFDYKFKNLAYFDNLLGLPNGVALEEDLAELASAESVALLFCNIEDFWTINELYGWENGDKLLLQIKDWLLASESRRAQLYRMHNGFAILGRKVTLDGARDRAREILERFNRPWELTAGGKTLSAYCTVKVGIVVGKYVQNEMRSLMLRTIRAARQSRSGYAIYDEREDTRVRGITVMRDSLISCIRNDMRGFEVHYQPIVDVGSQRWTAVEALCRWTMPDGTRASPAEFIGVAEQLDMIDQLDRWVRKTAMAQCVSLGLDKKRFFLDVNFSPTQKIDRDFIDNLLLTARESSFPAEKLNLEITESEKMTFDEENLGGLKNLKEEGIVLSLDDFGTGYSSFANLIKIPAHALKTDKMFLDGIENDSYRQYLLNMLVDVAHHLGMSLIAEGVETREHFELLKMYNVDCIQGYYFSKPLSYQQLMECVDRFN